MLADGYTAQHPNLTLTVEASNSEIGLRAANQFTNTLGMVARAIQPAELSQTRAVVIARDGIAIIVNRANPINAIMRSQVADVFAGNILTWPVGPNVGKAISVISREAGSGTRDAFETLAMNGLRVTRTAIVMPSEAAVVDYVARHPEAIAYCSMGGVTDEVHALIVDNAPLSPQTVEAKTYPYVRALTLVVPLAADPALQDFVNFAASADGQQLVAQKFARAP